MKKFLKSTVWREICYKFCNMANPKKRNNFFKAFFLSYLCVLATSPFLVHLHTQLHDHLNALPSAPEELSSRDWKFVVAEFMLSVLTGEERNDDTGGSPQGQLVVKGKTAEVTETTHLKLRSLTVYTHTSVDHALLLLRAATAKITHQDCPNPLKNNFHALHFGLSPPFVSSKN